MKAGGLNISKWRRFAPLGLYLALLAALATVGLYIVFREFNLYVQISLGLIVIGLALFALLDPDRVRRALTGRQARYGSNALVLFLAFVGILVVINYLAYNNNKRWDLTEDKVNTLAPETLDTLGQLQEPVMARAFYTAATNGDSAKSLLDQYKSNSDGKFDYEFINPDANPVMAEQAKITRDGSIVLLMGERQEPVTFASEQELTGALVRLMNPEKRTVYFLIGHGEYSPDDSGDQSFSQVKRTLESKNYTVKTFNLLAENKIPEDAKTIVVAGSRQPLTDGEVSLLQQYLDNGGALVVLTEPLPLTQFGDQPDPLGDYLNQTWGVTLGRDVVVDLSSQQVFAAIAASYGNHPITEKMQRMVTIFPSARSVSANTSAQGRSLVELVLTSQQSWGETNLSGLDAQPPEINFDQGQDLPGPVSLAVAGEDFTTQARLVVYGDADFVTDANYRVYGNGDLFVNSVDWAIGQEELISLTPKNNTQRLLAPPQSAMMNLLLLGTVIVLPGLALVGGIVVFVQRRRRG